MGRKARRGKRGPYVPFFEEERDRMTVAEVAYLFHVGERAVLSWRQAGRLIAVPDAVPMAFAATEVRRLYEEVGGLPEGPWRGWPRLAKSRGR